MIHVVGIIPTQNRPDDFTRLIYSINHLKESASCDFSFIVVDNSINANVAELVKGSICKFDFIYIHQPIKGLSNARNAGIIAVPEEADYIVTIDDDIILPPTYLEDLLIVISENPEAGLIGSRVELFDSTDLPITIKTDSVKQSYNKGTYIFGFVHGCSMLIRYDVVKAVGEFDPKLGAGSLCGGAEDSDYYYRIWLKGYEVIYNPKSYVFHNHGRKTELERERLYANYTIGQGAFYCKYIIMKYSLHAFKLLYWGMLSDYKSHKVNMLGKISKLCKGAFYYFKSGYK